MKKEDPDITLLDLNVNSNKDSTKENFKTTNINILLNRVRQDKKKTLKKRIIFSFFAVAAISILTVYFII